MKNIQVIEAFVAGKSSGKAGNLYIDGSRLINYSTVIAQRSSEGLLLNVTRYSVSTSRIQNMLKKEVRYSGINFIELDDLHQGVQNLTRNVSRSQIS